jgi:KaiC/GvpD/RAD55 family RecA-like ATPase
MQFDAVRMATSTLGKGDEGLDTVVDLLNRAQRIGACDSSTGTTVGPASFDVILRMREVQRMRTGIMELDDILDGGYVRGTETVFLGDTGGGKSMALVQSASSAALQGFIACYATLELPVPIVLARLKANLTGVPTNDILYDDAAAERSKVRLAEIQVAGFGGIVVKEFTPKATTPDDLFRWVRDVEREIGRDVDVLVVDYADKLAVPKQAESGKEKGEYAGQLLIYEGLRVWATTNRRWVITASQASRSKDRTKKLDTSDVADSLHKVRVADLVITLNPRGEENDQMISFGAKNRLGKGRASVGPLPTEFACARVSPVIIDAPPEGAPF